MLNHQTLTGFVQKRLIVNTMLRKSNLSVGSKALVCQTSHESHQLREISSVVLSSCFIAKEIRLEG
jgi:hypothetical protein